MPLKFEELPEWTFEVREISVGVYQVTGKDGFGRLVEMTGLDPEKLIEECKDAALKIMGSSF